MKPLSTTVAGDLNESHPAPESWFDDACLLDIDNFVKTLSSIKAKGVHSDLLASLISHYASKWLPELSGRETSTVASINENSPESSVAAWTKKRFFIETLIGILPGEKDSIQCGFLLRLLRAASMVEVSPACMAELEARVAAQLDRAALKEVMIPAFRHTCGTVLDVGLVLRLVRKFGSSEDVGKSGAAAAARVAKLVDSYLAEAALDGELTVEEFGELARAVPSHARSLDDGLYRAIDTYIMAHPGTSKQERKALCKLMDSRKLSSEASIHATQNERLPLRSIIHILFSDHSKIARLATADRSGSFSLLRSPLNSSRCHSKREVLAQHQEVRRLRDDVSRLQLQCQSLQAQIDRLSTDKNKKSTTTKKGLFSWSPFLFRNSKGPEIKYYDPDVKAGRTPVNATKATRKWRNSSS